MAKKTSNWWGVSQDFGWVWLDRKDPRNESSSPTRIFIQCATGKELLVSKKEWNEPSFIRYEKYLSTLEPEQEKVAREEFRVFQKKFRRLEQRSRRRRKYEAIRQEMEVAERNADIQRDFNRYMKKLGKDPLELIPCRKNHSDHCWKCQQTVDSRLDLCCQRCGWIVCSNCLACGCEYRLFVETGKRLRVQQRKRTIWRRIRLDE